MQSRLSLLLVPYQTTRSFCNKIIKFVPFLFSKRKCIFLKTFGIYARSTSTIALMTSKQIQIKVRIRSTYKREECLQAILPTLASTTMNSGNCQILATRSKKNKNVISCVTQEGILTA